MIHTSSNIYILGFSLIEKETIVWSDKDDIDMVYLVGRAISRLYLFWIVLSNKKNETKYEIKTKSMRSKSSNDLNFLSKNMSETCWYHVEIYI